MARSGAFTAGLALGIALATGVMVGHADDVQANVIEAAAAAKVDPIKLQGAVISLEAAGLPADPYGYLRSVGELPPLPREPVAPPNPRVECIISHESGGDPGATNARSKAAGLGQFLWSTWLTTPQGKAGLSPYNAAANRAAIAYMLDAGRAREFDAVRYFGC
jgi:hypothetical protein